LFKTRDRDLFLNKGRPFGLSSSKLTNPSCFLLLLKNFKFKYILSYSFLSSSLFRSSSTFYPYFFLKIKTNTPHNQKSLPNQENNVTLHHKGNKQIKAANCNYIKASYIRAVESLYVGQLLLHTKPSLEW